MPLSEFLRMVRGKLEPGQQIPYSADLSSRAEDDLVELVWENGQIVMQGQSSRVTRNPTLHDMPPNPHRVRDASIISRTGKFGGVESFLNDISPILPSENLDLGQDDEMVPWLNYHMDDPLPQYCDDLLPEISGITGNGMSTQNSFVPAEKKSSFENGGNDLKVSSSSKKRLFTSWPPQQGQIPDPSLGSGVSEIVNNNSNNNPNVTYGNSAHPRDVGMTSNNSNFLNFSHFSRPATLVKSDLPNSDKIPASGLQRIEIKDKALVFNVNDRFNATQKGIDVHVPPAACTVVSSTQPLLKESFPTERTENLCRENSLRNEKPLILGNGTADAAKGVLGSKRAVEPMVASSSVGSGNSVDRLSNEPTHNSKRKFRDIEYSESQGDDIKTEFADVKKPNSGRGGNGSKRSRAAEVHNLSERRRRDRINEKMCALQKLIPNCNKADKASMLDEAIEYLKTLQLQVQIMSMGAGLCMPPMMFPTGMLPPYMPHFSPMGLGMSMGMGFGMGMVDMNGGSSSGFPGPSMHGAQYSPSPMPGPMMNFTRMPCPVYGHPSSLPRAPLVTSAMGLSAPIIGSHNELPLRSPTLNLENPLINKNSQLMKNVEASSSIKHSSSNQVQATKQVVGQSSAVQENKQSTDFRGTAALNSTKSTTDISKEVGGD